MTLIVLCGLAFCITVGVTPIVIRIAYWLNVVDQPDGHRKLQDSAVPLGGGAAVWLGIVTTLIIGATYSHSANLNLFADTQFLIALIMASTVICVVGLLDDRFEIIGRQKLLGQFIAVSVLVVEGFVIEKINLWGLQLELGLLALPFTYFWMLGAINAINLIDGMDGLATTVGIVLSGAMAGMAALSGHPSECLFAMIILASLAGFLPYNFPPARIYLGDAGSMLIGLLLGALAIRGSLKGPATVALAAPVAIWALLIFDVGMAVLRRKLTGRSLYASDRGHLHHCLLRRGFGNRKALAWIGGLCVLTSGGALIGVYYQNDLLGMGCVTLILVALVFSQVFGHLECRLLLKRCQSAVRSVVPGLHSPILRRGEFLARLDGTREWEDLWNSILEFAERFDMVAVKLNVSLPVLQEEFHAQWTRSERSPSQPLWSTDVPLIANNITVGRLQITGNSPPEDVCAWMGDLIFGLKPLESMVSEILNSDFSEEEQKITRDSPRERNDRPSVLRINGILEGSQV